jgi:Uncharacterised nucleotidyltransferase
MPTSSHEAIGPEKQLLLCCARTKLSPPAEKKIRELLRYEINWDRLREDAHDHSVLPLLDRHLRAVAPELIPPAVAEQLKTETRANAVRCLALSAELLRITNALAEAGVSGLPYKGPVIASQAYGDITAREFEDLDVVLRHRDLDRANEAIRTLGYEPRFPQVHARGDFAAVVPGEYNYTNPERRTILEVHTDRTLRHFPNELNLDPFFLRATNVDLGGRPVRTFAPEDALIFLAVHAAKDSWQKLVWATDVAELIQSHAEMDWAVLVRRASDLNAQRMLHVNLALASDLFDARLPMEAAASVQADERANELAQWAEKNLLGPASQTLDSRGRFRFRRQMVGGFFAGWRYALRLALAPAEDDWSTVRLPRALAPLYVLLRPLRLLRKYGWSERQA